MAPSAAPAPTTVWSSSRNVMTLALGGLDLGQYRLEALFELAPIFGACHHRPQVEGNDPATLQTFGNVAVGYAAEPNLRRWRSCRRPAHR